MTSTTGPASGGSAASPHTWMKNHTLEGDGVLTGFYNHLWKRNKDFQSCRDVMIPDTIVYDHNFPRSWYTYDKKHKNIEKRQGKDLDPTSIYESFSKTKDADVNIVATYMFSFEDSNTGNVITSVEFFNERGLQEFVNRKVKKEGILQKFVLPKGHNNSVIQAVWSPRICVVQRRMNINPIRDKALTDRDPYCCAVTYEGPTHYSEESSCASRTTQQIERMCLNIVHHFYNTEHKSITRMVVYFKVDPNDMVWLLWCGSIRISERHTPSQMPVNLAPIFTTPSADEANVSSAAATNQQKLNASIAGSSTLTTSLNQEDRTLLEMDLLHSAMAHDVIFKKNFIISPREKATRVAQRAAMKQSKRAAHATSGNDGGITGASHALDGGVGAGENEYSYGRSGRTRWGGKYTERSHNGDHLTEWFDRDEVTRERYEALSAERDTVIAHFDDIFYAAYGHFMLHHDPEPFYFTVDASVCSLLGTDVVMNLMEHLHISKATRPPLGIPSSMADSEGGNQTSLDVHGLHYYISTSDTMNQHHAPITKLGDEAIHWLTTYYEAKEAHLKGDGGTISSPPIATNTMPEKNDHLATRSTVPVNADDDQ